MCQQKVLSTHQCRLVSITVTSSRVKTFHIITAQTVSLTFDVEVLRVALAVALGVGGDARVEPGLAAAHGLQHERPVPDQHAAGHVLVHEFSLGGKQQQRN